MSFFQSCWHSGVYKAYKMLWRPDEGQFRHGEAAELRRMGYAIRAIDALAICRPRYELRSVRMTKSSDVP